MNKTNLTAKELENFKKIHNQVIPNRSKSFENKFYSSKNSNKNLDPIIKHAISEVTKGLLSSQSHGMDHFNVVTIFPINFQKKNMDMKLIVNLSRVMIQLFPKKLLKYYVYNPPKIFNIMWGALRIVMDKDLRQKVVLVKPDNTIISNLDNNEEFNIL